MGQYPLYKPKKPSFLQVCCKQCQDDLYSVPLWIHDLKHIKYFSILKNYLPFESTGWHIILVLITSAGVPIVAAIKPEQILIFFYNSFKSEFK